MKTKLAAAPIALALALSLGACGKHDDAGNAASANETVLNDEDVAVAGDENGSVSNDTFGNAALDNAVPDNGAAGNETAGGNAL